MLPSLKDADLVQSIALPANASSVYTAGFQVNTAGYEFNASMELLVSAPALAVGQLANASTMKYEIQMAADAAFTSPISVYGVVLTQTGAGGVGDVAATKRVRLPSDCLAYVRLKVTNSAAADASAKSATLSQLF